MEKLCSTCKFVKPASEFHKNKTKVDGLQTHCRSCRNAKRGKVRREVAVNPDYVKPVIELVLTERPCELCDALHIGEYGSGRFCSSRCASNFSTLAKREEINKKVSEKLRGRRLSEEHKAKLIRKPGHPRLRCCDLSSCSKEFKPRSKTNKYCSYDCWLGKTRENKNAMYVYRRACAFAFNVYDYPKLFNLQLIEEHGWYSAANRGGNMGGVSRDHMYSVKEGFTNDVDPGIIAHPVNCELMRHPDNNRKKCTSSISLVELRERIKNFNN